ncbi:MAG: bacteriophage abortive infection AbiH family protein [Muribaculaceae bacterium]|nr:bacteriophage abortive infection AbiH family protein [Muribaculaceae bacterium]
MKHLYIIGNGFDLFTGLHTSYAHFRRWLEINYVFVYENMVTAYNMEGEWWSDFETQLGQLDVEDYVRRFTKPEKPLAEIIADLEARRHNERKVPVIPHLCSESPCANRLRGLLEILQFCFERWVGDCQRMITDPKYTHIEKDDSFFINFNYTDVLEWLYEIPEERVLHIHGRASKHERLIFGHNQSFIGNMYDGPNHDIERTCFELSKYEKNPYEHIFKYDNLREIISDTKEIHVYGLSMSPVDEDYLDWIEEHTPLDCKWEFSWYTEKDKEHINKFVLDHWRIKDRYSIMRLQQVSN